MKITRLGQATPLLSATSLGGSGGTLDPVVGGGLVPTASGSNSWSWGSNVSQIFANGSNALLGPLVNFTAGSNITLAVSSNTMTITSAAGGGSTSYGSNSNAVASANDAGASTLASRADHVHLGVRSLAHSSNSFSGPVILTASGTLGITSPTPGTYNLSAGTGGGGSALTVKDEGTPLATDATSLDFVGAGVVASGVGAAKTITIAGGSGSTIQYGGLKPATPLDDFGGTSLDGAWSAHSSQGSFATTDCFTQALDGSHLSMGFGAKTGRLYRTATNTNQEWLVGGIVPDGGMLTGTEPMFGMGLLTTAGTGVGIVVYNDGNAYLCSITTWAYGAFTGTFTGYGHNLLRHGPYALRLVRVGNVFTGYISIDGQTWVAASSTLTSTFTVGYKAVGLFYNNTIAYKGRLFVDWVHTA